MSERAQTLAARLDQANKDLIGLLQGCTEEQWRQPCADEGRSVGVVAHHVADAHTASSGWLRAIVAGEPLPGLTHADIDNYNARRASAHPDPLKDDTLRLLGTTGAAAVALVAGLTDDQLARSGSMPLFGERPLTADQMIRYVMIAHVQGHLQGLRQTLGA
jgi:hypothetical protein